ncbi:MAG: DUF4367 domain-containing protein [Oscillospiraceae bacterium]|nr:DUF4367 domain-containing protein [Oscillospiraceae bacterium]
MIFPLDNSKNQPVKPVCMDVSADRLSSLSVSELADNMELALDYMTEETYDAEIISAYIEAMDHKSPMPEHTDAAAAYSEFCQRIEPIAAERTANIDRRIPRRFSGLHYWARVGVAAAVLVLCVFSGMIAVQASGIDVFGALARWTESIFVFVGVGTGAEANLSSENENVPEEYKELQVMLQERGLPLYVPAIPEEFAVIENVLYIQPDTGFIQANILYEDGERYIVYGLVEHNEPGNMYYEKDDSNVEVFEYNGVMYYIFANNGNTVAAWSVDSLEYTLSTNQSSDFLEDIIRFDDN